MSGSNGHLQKDSIGMKALEKTPEKTLAFFLAKRHQPGFDKDILCLALLESLLGLILYFSRLLIFFWQKGPLLMFC